MSIDNVLFPNLKLIHGFTREILGNILIVDNNSSGLEKRIRKSPFERYIWSFQGTNVLSSDVQTLHKFWQERGNGHHSFKFQDPYYPEFNNALLASAGGTTWYLNIPYSSSQAGEHPVFNFDVTTTATVNGTPTGIAGASIDSSGRPIITITGTTGTEEVRITGPCYLTARFDRNLSWSMAALDSDNLPYVDLLGEVRLKEVFETTIS